MLPLDAFVQFVEVSEGDRGAFRLDGGDARWCVALGERPGAQDGACTFLLTFDDGVERCGVYPHRPQACRLFPLEIRKGAPAVRKNITCPAGSWRGDPAPFLPSLLRGELEWAMYEQALVNWNVAAETRTSPAEPALFIAWLMEVCHRLELLRADLGEACLAEAAADLGEYYGGDETGPAAAVMARIDEIAALALPAGAV